MSVQTGLINGKLPGKGGSDWPLFYVELYEDTLHIYEGNEDPSRPRRQIRTMEVHSTDLAYNKDKDKKRDYRFQYERFDGKYIFKCTTLEERNTWVSNLQKMIQRKEYMEKGLLPESSYSQATHSPSAVVKVDSPSTPKASTLHSHRSIDATTPPPPPPHKRDSGFISGTGDARMYRGGMNTFSGDSTISHGKHNSGDSAIVHNTSVLVERLKGSHSDDGKFVHRTNITTNGSNSNSSACHVDESELERNDWYWGEMNRDDCVKGLQEKGTVGNFVVRKSKGEYVMSFWRKDGVHHHRILRTGGSFQFEKSVVQATGMSIPDLLDTYMKCCTDKTIGPYGGQLYPNYDDPWNPPDIDFNKMQQHLAKKAQESGTKRIFKPGSGMGEHTYGGLSLEQMKSVLEHGEGFTTSATQSYPAITKSHGVPTPLAGFLPNASSGKKINKSPRSSFSGQPAASPKPNKESVAVPSPKHDPRSGYVNLFPLNQKKIEEEELSDDEEQEVYINPEEIDQPNEAGSLYENCSFRQQTNIDDESIYQNVVGTPTTVHKKGQSLTNFEYANVTYDGKPLPQPRQKVNRKKK